MPISLVRAGIQASFFGRLSLKVRRLSALALHKSATAANAWPDRPLSIRQQALDQVRGIPVGVPGFDLVRAVVRHGIVAPFLRTHLSRRFAQRCMKMGGAGETGDNSLGNRAQLRRLLKIGEILDVAAIGGKAHRPGVVEQQSRYDKGAIRPLCLCDAQRITRVANSSCYRALSLLSWGVNKPRNLRRAVEAPQRLERADDVAERTALDPAFAVLDVYLAEEVVGQVDVAAAYRFSYPFLKTLSGILNCPPVAANLSAKISRTLGSSSG